MTFQLGMTCHDHFISCKKKSKKTVTFSNLSTDISVAKFMICQCIIQYITKGKKNKNEKIPFH